MSAVQPGERCVLITGAGRGLGQAMALHLAAPGTRLFLHHGASAEGARETAREAEARGAATSLFQADLGQAKERKTLMAGVAAAAPRLEVMINSAGWYRETALLETSLEEWEQALAVNCTAVFHLIQLALPLLRSAEAARVVNLGDSGADRITARTQATAYHAAKLGVHLLTRSLAKSLAGEGITVNLLSPGFLENSVGEPGSPLPMGREGRFEDVLGALDYLLSEGAAYVTGANIVVAGGWNL